MKNSAMLPNHPFVKLVQMPPSDTEQNLLAVVDRIYQSIEQPALWPEVFGEIGELIGGPPAFWRLDGAITTANPRVLDAGCHSGNLLSRSDFKAIENYVNDFGETILQFLQIMFLETIWSKQGEILGSIGQRLASQYIPLCGTVCEESYINLDKQALRDFIATLWEHNQVLSAEKLKNIRLLLPHLKRATRLQLKHALDNVHSEVGSIALEYLTLGVMFVDRTGRPIWRNRRAQEIANETRKLGLLSTGGLPANSADSWTLRQRFEASLSAGQPDLLAVRRGPGARPLLLMTIPLPQGAHLPAPNGRACGVVFISDPDRMDEPSVDAVRQAFGLTYREAQVAVAIANGHGLQAAADTMGIALTTARSQLQQAFAKTSTGHQAELAALVHRTLSRVRYDLS